MTTVWTDEMLVALDGPGTNEAVAKRLGITEATVAGKRFRVRKARERARLGIERTVATPEELRDRDNARRRNLRARRREESGKEPLIGRPPKAATPAPPPAEKPKTGPADTLYRLVPRPEKPRPVATGMRACRWPVNNGALADGARGWLFCEGAVEAGRPYCPQHCDVAYSRKPQVGA
jgi:hypothetical protein